MSMSSAQKGHLEEQTGISHLVLQGCSQAGRDYEGVESEGEVADQVGSRGGQNVCVCVCAFAVGEELALWAVSICSFYPKATKSG